MSGAAGQGERGNKVGAAVGVHHQKSICVPMWGPENTRTSPSGDHTGSTECPEPGASCEPPSRGTLKRRGMPSTFGGHRNRLSVRRPRRSALQLERPRDDSRVRAVGVYNVQHRLSVLLDREGNATSSRAIAGPPMIRVSGALHSSVAPSPCSFQILSLAPLEETSSR